MAWETHRPSRSCASRNRLWCSSIGMGTVSSVHARCRALMRRRWVVVRHGVVVKRWFLSLGHTFWPKKRTLFLCRETDSSVPQRTKYCFRMENTICSEQCARNVAVCTSPHARTGTQHHARTHARNHTHARMHARTHARTRIGTDACTRTHARTRAARVLDEQLRPERSLSQDPAMVTCALVCRSSPAHQHGSLYVFPRRDLRDPARDASVDARGREPPQEPA